MARKKKPEEHVNLERWLVSYADFITLLFAFFVVMYAISSVNEGKYRVMADSIKSALQSTPHTLSPVQFGDPGMSVKKPRLQHSDRIGKSQTVIKHTQLEKPSHGDVVQEVSSSMKALIDKGLISIKTDKNWIEIEISNDVLFQSGSAKLQPEAVPLLKVMSRILNKFPNAIQVAGYTDNQPIRTEIFPSNWELSAARSASVVRLFARSGIDPERLTVVGYGSTRPLGDNKTAKGRNRNRRVVLIINKKVERQSADLNGHQQQQPHQGQSAAPPTSPAKNEVPLVSPSGEEVIIDTKKPTVPKTAPANPSTQRIFRDQGGE